MPPKSRAKACTNCGDRHAQPKGKKCPYQSSALDVVTSGSESESATSPQILQILQYLDDRMRLIEEAPRQVPRNMPIGRTWETAVAAGIIVVVCSITFYLKTWYPEHYDQYGPTLFTLGNALSCIGVFICWLCNGKVFIIFPATFAVMWCLQRLISVIMEPAYYFQLNDTLAVITIICFVISILVQRSNI